MLSKQLKLVSKQRAFLKLSYQSPLTTKLSNEISAGNKTQRDKREGGGEGEGGEGDCELLSKLTQNLCENAIRAGTVQRSRAALTGYPHEMTAVNGDGAF